MKRKETAKNWVLQMSLSQNECDILAEALRDWLDAKLHNRQMRKLATEMLNAIED